MSSPLSSATRSAPARRYWRQFLLWGAFVLMLAAGLGFAVVNGREAPVLLDEVAP